MIKILDTNLNRLGIIKNAIEASRIEEINGENILDFTAILDAKLNTLITENSIFELNNDYFDAKFLKKLLNADSTYTIVIESEHISYRLNDPVYNAAYFTEYGTPTYIMGKILEGTPFTVGTVEFVDVVTYSAQESKSRRQLLMEFAASLTGELIFDKFAISLVVHRGSTTLKPVIKDRNVNVISKTVNKRVLDPSGNPTISYACTPVHIPLDNYSLGDDILLKQKTLGIQELLRVVRIESNPYNDMETTFEFANYVNDLASSIYQIVTSAVIKDKEYNGIRIGPEYGFEAVRNDKKARSYLRSDGMVFQSGDGTGNTWRDRLYYDYDAELDETVLVFDGSLSADLITALSGIITPNLYAGKAAISELTVDRVETSTKIQKYLNSDTSGVNYLKIEGQVIQFIMATVVVDYGGVRTSSGTWDVSINPQNTTYASGVMIDNIGTIAFSNESVMDAGDAFQAGRIYRSKSLTEFYKLTGYRAGVVSYDIYTVEHGSIDNFEQVKDRDGNLLYWVDETHTLPTTDVSAFPVYMYRYNELIKMEHSFYYDDSQANYVPLISLGAGIGDGNKGKGFIYKGTTGLHIDYYSRSGDLRRILLNDDGIVLTPYALKSLNFYSNGFSAIYSGEAVAYTWTLDVDGRIISLTSQDLITIPVTWNAGAM